MSATASDPPPRDDIEGEVWFWCYRQGTQFNLDLGQFKQCTAHFERMKQRPSVQKLLADEKSVQTEFAKVV